MLVSPLAWPLYVILQTQPGKDDVSARDIVVGIAVLAVFLPVCYVIGKSIARVKNRWFSGAWAPLMPVLSGARITSDGGVAVTSRLSGTYRGASVHALMTPNVHRSEMSEQGNGNYFTVAVENVSGVEGWSIDWDPGLPLISSPHWTVLPSGTPLADRLRSAGVIAHVEPFGPATIEYRPRDHVIEWGAFIEPRVILSPGQFRQLLDALLVLEVINGRVDRL